MEPESVKIFRASIGDLVRINDSGGGFFTLGIYLGISIEWKDFHMVHHDGQTNRYDEPFWRLEIVNANR